MVQGEERPDSAWEWVTGKSFRTRLERQVSSSRSTGVANGFGASHHLLVWASSSVIMTTRGGGSRACLTVALVVMMLLQVRQDLLLAKRLEQVGERGPHTHTAMSHRGRERDRRPPAGA